MELKNLDETTRRFMRAEVERDVSADTLYISPRLSIKGRSDYEDILLDAVNNGSAHSLSQALRVPGRLNTTEIARRSGKEHVRRVPVNAAETLGEGEFNRFYTRGLCARAVAEQISGVRVYRAKDVANPRSASVAMIGRVIDPATLLDDLRTHIGVEPALGLPPGPNSGLSIELL